ncbi:hypothetical protein KAX02_11205 [candidate division WOR-3 bacterium]|nr:hypothetical protein [candidate division WOR-3 bacterium]MCK4330397.1 hypothetical protein [candidate division WOR-3 bacterium]
MKIDVYSTNTCPPCLALKQWLYMMKIPYTNHDVSNDTVAATYLTVCYGNSVPVIEIDGKGIVGFQKEKIKEMILESMKNDST